MKRVPLSQLASVSAGQSAPKDHDFSDSGTPFVRAGSLESLLSGKSEADLELVSAETAKRLKLKTYPKGTILFAKSGMSATKDRIYVLQNPAHVVSHLATLIPKEVTHPDYLRLALKRFPPSSLIKDPAYPAISLGEIEGFEIPVPKEYEDQIRIAHLLGKVEALITQRKQHLQQLDDLLKSVFLEMFGDPVRNEKAWSTKTLQQLVFPGKNSLKRGPFGGALKKEIFVETGYLVYEQNHALNNDYSFERYFVTEEKYQELIDFRVVPGDVLISCSGVYLGKLSIVPAEAKPGIINQALLKVSLDPQKIQHKFFVHVFASPQFKEKFIPSNRGGAIPNLPPMSVMKEIPFIYPPLELQDKFVKFSEKVEGLKYQYQQALLNLEAIYGSLSQQAFKGELDLSRLLAANAKTEEVNS